MRVDLHLHTPAFETFRATGFNLEERDAIERFAAAYAARLEAAGISLAAITDYNGIRTEWYEPIKQAAELRGITVLPGAELTLVSGRAVHILAVFEAGADPERINEEIRHLHREPGLLWEGRRKKEIYPQEGISNALQKLRDRTGCILIPAHAADDSGIVKELRVGAAVRLLEEVRFDALDHPAGAIHQIKSCREAGDVAKSMTVVEFSDCKCLDEVGSKEGTSGIRETWLKLTEPSLDAIRFALRDPEMRVRTSVPPRPSNARVVSVEVEGTGFLGGCRVEFDPHLNTLIGGFGTGKTALLQVLGYGLDARGLDEDDGPDIPLIRHALGDGGRVRVCVERPGAGDNTRTYIIERVLDRAPEVMGLTGVNPNLSPRSVFDADHEPILLRHGSISSMSRSVERCRNLFDRLIGSEVEDARQRLAKAQDDLQTNAQELKKYWKLEEERSEIRPRLAMLKEREGDYAKSGLAEKLKMFTQMQERARTLGRATSSLQARTDMDARWRADFDDLRAELNRAVDSLASDPGADEMRTKLDELLTALQDNTAMIQEALQNMARKASEVESGSETELAQMKASYESVRQELNAEGHNPDEFERVREEIGQVEERIGQIDLQLAGFEQLRERREAFLDELELGRV